MGNNPYILALAPRKAATLELRKQLGQHFSKDGIKVGYYKKYSSEYL